MNIGKEIGPPATLEQTAEECVELADAIASLLRLAHGCQKEARRLRGENPTPATEEECRAAIREEMADVSVCLGQLNEIGYPIDMEIVRSKIERWEYRIGSCDTGERGKGPSDRGFRERATNYLPTVKIRSDGDLILRGSAMSSIRRKCISGHTPWSSSSPQGRTALEALAAVNGVPAVEWSEDMIGRLIYNCIAERFNETQAPLNDICAQFYADMNDTFRDLAGVDISGGTHENN